MKIKLSNINLDVNGEYNLEAINLEMPQITFSIKHILSFTMSRVKDFTVKQIVDYNLSPKIMRDMIKRLLSVINEATTDGRRNIIITIGADAGKLELIGKRKEMNIIANLFNKQLKR